VSARGRGGDFGLGGHRGAGGFVGSCGAAVLVRCAIGRDTLPANRSSFPYAPSSFPCAAPSFESGWISPVCSSGWNDLLGNGHEDRAAAGNGGAVG